MSKSAAVVLASISTSTVILLLGVSAIGLTIMVSAWAAWRRSRSPRDNHHDPGE